MGKKTIKRKRKSASKSRKPKVDSIPLWELKSIVSQIKSGQTVSTEAVEKLDAAIDTLGVVTNELEAKGASIKRLRNLLFGASTEKMSNVFPDSSKTDDITPGAGGSKDDKQSKDDSTTSPSPNGSEKPKPKGHGRNGADKYTGADKQRHVHGSLTHKGDCPIEGCTGKLYRQKDPKRLIRVTGVAPLTATVHEMERLRCNLCGKVFTAKSPDGVGEETYDNKARAMIALLKYGSGTPFNRLEQLQSNLGIPLPSSTQWDEIEKLAHAVAPVYTELIAQAANGKVLHNDDTTAKILKLESTPLVGKNGKERTGLFTSGILSLGDNREIALFFTGRDHAGGNLEKVLAKRNRELSAPIQMCDGMNNVNTSGNFETLLANCNTHARRNFVEVADSYPKETKHILQVFKAVYKNDDNAKGMSAEERMSYHLKHSKQLFDEMKQWFYQIMEDENERYVEPNSILGDAIQYMNNHWDELTLFLRVPGAPLDNNACERILKKAILHRKNAMFFRTENGAHTADIFMSIIHTSELGNINPFEYLVAIADNQSAVFDCTTDWLPWNYHLSTQK